MPSRPISERRPFDFRDEEPIVRRLPARPMFSAHFLMLFGVMLAIAVLSGAAVRILWGWSRGDQIDPSASEAEHATDSAAQRSQQIAELDNHLRRLENKIVAQIKRNGELTKSLAEAGSRDEKIALLHQLQAEQQSLIDLYKQMEDALDERIGIETRPGDQEWIEAIRKARQEAQKNLAASKQLEKTLDRTVR
jgi:hypothetical protein